MKAIALGLLLVASAAAAKCAGVDDCGCGDSHNWAGLVRWDSDGDGGAVPVIETDTKDAGRDIFEYAIPVGVPGTRAVVTSSGLIRPVLADGGLRCQNVTVAAAAWPGALVDGGCGQMLAAAGFQVPVCRDNGTALVGCGCGTTGSWATAAIALTWMLRRRR